MATRQEKTPDATGILCILFWRIKTTMSIAYRRVLLQLFIVNLLEILFPCNGIFGISHDRECEFILGEF
jgi:hypothetical protein